MKQGSTIIGRIALLAAAAQVAGCASWDAPRTAFRAPSPAAASPIQPPPVLAPQNAIAAASVVSVAAAAPLVVRGQDGYGNPWTTGPAPTATNANSPWGGAAMPAANAPGAANAAAPAPAPVLGYPPPPGVNPELPPLGADGIVQPQEPHLDIDPAMTTPVDVFVQETQTGRIMFGAGINSDAGVTGQVVIDERNFDITAWPDSWRDWGNGTAFRGAGQGFRVEAMPGNQVQRYLVSFTEPYLFHTPVSFNASAFLFDRRYYDWTESRVGGRMSFGYRLAPDTSLAASLRGELVDIKNPRVLGVPELDAALGKNALYSGRLSLTNDTRDIPFAPTEGHLIELAVEQAFGDFSFPRADLDIRQYFLIRERPDGSGRHTLGFNFQLGFSGSDTPIFENYFAGGYSTLRGFNFRGASPIDQGVRIGGEFRMLGSCEYLFPLTADDMIKGALFVDFGTVEEKIQLSADTYRVAPGFGVRLNIPALGPAPLALDFTFPVAHADTDDIRTFSFFMGVGR